MTYPIMPTGLRAEPRALMDWMKQVQTELQSAARELSDHSSGGTLTVDLASGYLDKFTWASAANDLVFEAMEELDTTDEMEDSLDDMARIIHEFASEMTQLTIGWLREKGVNGNLLWKQAQDRHYP